MVCAFTWMNPSRAEFTRGHRGQVPRAPLLKGAPSKNEIGKIGEKSGIRKDKMKEKSSHRRITQHLSLPQFTEVTCRRPHAQWHPGDSGGFFDGRQYHTPYLITIDYFGSISKRIFLRGAYLLTPQPCL